MSEDLESEVSMLIASRIQDGDVPHSALEYASERVGADSALSPWVEALLKKGPPPDMEGVADEMLGDELFMRGMKRSFERFWELVAEKMVEDELERRVVSGEIERHVDENGTVSYSQLQPGLKVGGLISERTSKPRLTRK